MRRSEIGIGVIGGGYMGKAHSVAMSAVGAIFDTQLRPRLEMIAASSAQSAETYRDAYGFARAGANWEEVVEDKQVEAVIIASPQDTHLQIAKAAIALGKPVLCEKPMGLDLAQATEMTEAAEAAGVVNMVAYNYIRTPASRYARQLIEDGTLGEIVYFRGEHTEDFQNNLANMAAWRCSGDANGCIGDLAPHAYNAALALMGPIASLNAVIETVHSRRGDIEVTNDDQVQMMCRFAGGAMGHIFASRVASGRKMGYAYEVTGTKGALRFDQEDQNALWLYINDEDPAQQGFKKILTGPAHPDYEPFCLGPGHGTGYQDQIIIEAKDFLNAIAEGNPAWPTFRDGLDVHKVVAAARRSNETQSWQKVG